MRRTQYDRLSQQHVDVLLRLLRRRITPIIKAHNTLYAQPLKVKTTAKRYYFVKCRLSS